MNTPTSREHWLDEPKNIRLLWRSFLVILVLTVVAELFVHLHPAFPIEGWPGFHAAYGLLTCALMIVAAKGLGLLIKRPDTFYAKEDADE